MPPDENVLVEAQRLLAHALEVEHACAEFYAREAQRDHLEQIGQTTSQRIQPTEDQPSR